VDDGVILSLDLRMENRPGYEFHQDAGLSFRLENSPFDPFPTQKPIHPVPRLLNCSTVSDGLGESPT
jgi:hypothetical protein